MYVIRFYVDPYKGCLWSANAKTEADLGDCIDAARLPISTASRQTLNVLSNMLRSILTRGYFVGNDLRVFNAEAAFILRRLTQELKAVAFIIDEQTIVDADLDIGWAKCRDCGTYMKPGQQCHTCGGILWNRIVMTEALSRAPVVVSPFLAPLAKAGNLPLEGLCALGLTRLQHHELVLATEAYGRAAVAATPEDFEQLETRIKRDLENSLQDEATIRRFLKWCKNVRKPYPSVRALLSTHVALLLYLSYMPFAWGVVVVLSFLSISQFMHSLGKRVPPELVHRSESTAPKLSLVPEPAPEPQPAEEPGAEEPPAESGDMDQLMDYLGSVNPVSIQMSSELAEKPKKPVVIPAAKPLPPRLCKKCGSIVETGVVDCPKCKTECDTFKTAVILSVPKQERKDTEQQSEEHPLQRVCMDCGVVLDAKVLVCPRCHEVSDQEFKV